MKPDPEYVTRVLARLVQINSINPDLDPSGPGEAEIAAYVAERLQELGCRILTREPRPGRVSVAGTLPGSGGGPSLMLYAHSDTVSVDGMAEPWSGTVRGGRLYGRGSYDMKCGLAACLGALKALGDAGIRLRGDLVVCAVADEETESLGMRDLLEVIRTDAAIVTEPTELDLYVAHKGFCWIEVETQGRAAHGSRYQEGIDANLMMGRFLAALDGLERRLRERTPHRLLGPPSLHAAVLRGGTGWSTYAASCRLEIERRTLPGETPDQVLGEITALLDELRGADPGFAARARLVVQRPSLEGSPDSAIARAVMGAARDAGRDPAVAGAGYWMDAALIAAAGIDTVVMGPTGAGAHAAEEWVELESVVTLAGILAGAALRYSGVSAAVPPPR